MCVRACFPGGAWPWARAREARGARPPARLERERGWGWPAPLALTGNCFSLYLSLSLNSAPDAAGPPTPSLPAGCACPPARAHRPRGGGVRDGEEGQGRRGRKACGRACFFFFLGALPVLSRPAHARPSPAPPAPPPPFPDVRVRRIRGRRGRRHLPRARRTGPPQTVVARPARRRRIRGRHGQGHICQPVSRVGGAWGEEGARAMGDACLREMGGGGVCAPRGEGRMRGGARPFFFLARPSPPFFLPSLLAPDPSHLRAPLSLSFPSPLSPPLPPPLQARPPPWTG